MKEHYVSRFEEKIQITPGCWIWKSAKDSRGYGKFLFLGKLRAAHRIAYKIWNGEIPEGALIRHRCDNPSCMNPEHLVLGTNADNSRDMVERGRSWSKKLTSSKVKRNECLRAMSELGATNKELAYFFELHEVYVSNLLNGRKLKYE